MARTIRADSSGIRRLIFMHERKTPNLQWDQPGKESIKGSDVLGQV